MNNSIENVFVIIFIDKISYLELLTSSSIKNYVIDAHLLNYIKRNQTFTYRYYENLLFFTIKFIEIFND